MNNDTLKESLRHRLIDYVLQITTPSRKAGRDMYVCPLCGSGTHSGRSSDGAFHVSGDVWYCHSCERGGDIFKLIELYEGIMSFPDQIQRAAELLGTNVSEATKRTVCQCTKKEGINMEQKRKTERMKEIENFAANISGSPAENYLHERGFTDEIISRFSLGFNNQNGRVVIPYPGLDFKTERKITPDSDRKYLNPPDESIPLFVIKDGLSDYYYITEGQLDAISIYQAGAKNVIALGGGSYRLIEEYLSTSNIDGAVIIADRDSEEKRQKDGLTPGERTAEKIAKTLEDRKIKSITVYPPEGYKDSNDLLRDSPAKLKQFLAESKKKFLNMVSEELPKGLNVIRVGDYLSLDTFEQDIEYFQKYKNRKTGFENIDRYMTLYPGVACLGGASSLGKTTFAVNLADNLVKKGEIVIYFTLEQHRIELITKSLARRVFEIDPISPIDNIDIKNGASSEALRKAKSELSKTGQKYVIVEGDYHLTAHTIIDYVEGFIKKTGIRPVVMIDYLQLIAQPDGFKGTQREIIDENLKAIKDMSKRNELFVLLISSLNRASYKEPIGMESFKESGMIEYTCDYILGLQLSILEDAKFFTTKGVRGGERDTNNYTKEQALHDAINKSSKEVELVVLKNRNARQRFKCFFKYNMKFDTFSPDMNSPYDKELTLSRSKSDDQWESIPFKSV